MKVHNNLYHVQGFHRYPTGGGTQSGRVSNRKNRMILAPELDAALRCAATEAVISVEALQTITARVATAEDIVRNLAEGAPPVTGDFFCLLCGEVCVDFLDSHAHSTTCPYRLASDWSDTY